MSFLYNHTIKKITLILFLHNNIKLFHEAKLNLPFYHLTANYIFFISQQSFQIHIWTQIEFYSETWSRPHFLIYFREKFFKLSPIEPLCSLNVPQEPPAKRDLPRGSQVVRVHFPLCFSIPISNSIRIVTFACFRFWGSAWTFIWW